MSQNKKKYYKINKKNAFEHIGNIFRHCGNTLHVFIRYLCIVKINTNSKNMKSYISMLALLLMSMNALTMQAQWQRNLQYICPESQDRERSWRLCTLGARCPANNRAT